jgi:hypothetical protein
MFVDCEYIYNFAIIDYSYPNSEFKVIGNSGARSSATSPKAPNGVSLVTYNPKYNSRRLFGVRSSHCQLSATREQKRSLTPYRGSALMKLKLVLNFQ